MIWEEFCENNKVFKKFRDANIESITIPPDRNGDCFKRKAQSFLQKPCSLLLLGKSGRGKTYFMFALIRELLTKIRQYHLRYFRAIDLDERLVAEFEKFKSTQDFMEQLCEVHFLFIDDFGLERSTERAERDYYNLIDNRMGNEKITIFSSNLMKKEDLKTIYGERITSRLRDCAVVDFDGPDLRGGNRL